MRHCDDNGFFNRREAIKAGRRYLVTTSHTFYSLILIPASNFQNEDPGTGVIGLTTYFQTQNFLKTTLFNVSFKFSLVPLVWDVSRRCPPYITTKWKWLPNFTFDIWPKIWQIVFYISPKSAKNLTNNIIHPSKNFLMKCSIAPASMAFQVCWVGSSHFQVGDAGECLFSRNKFR